VGTTGSVVGTIGSDVRTTGSDVGMGTTGSLSVGVVGANCSSLATAVGGAFTTCDGPSGLFLVFKAGSS
jgi:hypothetical protein